VHIWPDFASLRGQDGALRHVRLNTVSARGHQATHRMIRMAEHTGVKSMP
jgi:hypothetical protein